MSLQEPDVYKDAMGSLVLPMPRRILANKALDENSKYRTYYQLDKTLDIGKGLGGAGVKAFGLVGIDQKDTPILLFHGTHLKKMWSSSGSGSTLVIDTDTAGIAAGHFKKNKARIQEWLQNHTTPKNKAIVAGQSLGGALGLYTSVNLSQYVKEAKIFHSPEVNRDTLDKWNSWERVRKGTEQKDKKLKSLRKTLLNNNLIKSTTNNTSDITQQMETIKGKIAEYTELIAKRRYVLNKDVPHIECFNAPHDYVSNCVGKGYKIGQHYTLKPSGKYANYGPLKSHSTAFFIVDKDLAVDKVSEEVLDTHNEKVKKHWRRRFAKRCASTTGRASAYVRCWIKEAFIWFT